MRIKKKNTTILLITLITITILTTTLTKTKTPTPQQILLNQPEVREFAQKHQNQTTITTITLTPTQTQKLKNSPQGALYRTIPNNTTIHITIITNKNQDGYLTIINAETNQIIKTIGIHNLQPPQQTLNQN